MKSLIFISLLVAQCNVSSCNPGIVDSPELRKARDKSSTSTRLNTIVPVNYEEKGSPIVTTPLTTTSYFPSTYESSSTFQTSPQTFQNSITSSYQPQSTSSFQPTSTSSFQPTSTSTFQPTSTSTFMPSLPFQQNQLIKGQNSVYGSQSPMSSGGLMFAINGQGVTTTPVMPGVQQPVLMQYLSPQGTPQTAAVQYIQLLRPVMMLQQQQQLQQQYFQQQQSNQVQSTASASNQSPTFQSSPYGPPFKMQNPVASFSSPILSYFTSNPRTIQMINPQQNLSFNMNEYIPSNAEALPVPAALTSEYQPYKHTKTSQMSQRA